MPSFATRLAAATVMAGLNLLTIGPAQAQQLNPNLSAGVGTSNLGALTPNIDLRCRIRPRACAGSPSAGQRDPASGRPDRNQPGGGARPGRR